MKKSIIITGIILIILFLIATTALVLSTSVDDAYVSFTDGDVQVQHKGKWHPAELGEKLSNKDSVKTAMGAAATIVLHESIIIQLEEGTETVIENLAKDDIKIFQKTGSTWNKFLKLNGVTDYTIATPNTVATVRGTEFGVTLDTIMVLKGELEINAQDQLYALGAGKVMTIDGEVNIRDATPEEKQYMLGKAKKTREALVQLRQRELDKNKATVNILKNFFDADQNDLLNFMKEIDTGARDADQAYEKSPIKTESVKRAVEISKQIHKQNELMEQLEMQ